MCWAAATTMLVGQVALKGMQIYQRNKAMAQQAQSQATDNIFEMNNSLMNYEQERQDAYDEAVNSIMKTQQNALQLNSQVEAAVAEDFVGGGRTADQITRSSYADTARNIASIQDNYKRKSNEIDLNKYAVTKSTARTNSALAKSAKPNRWADILELGSTAFSAYQTAQDIKLKRDTGGKY